MTIYVKKSDTCEYCGELARRPGQKATWYDGQPIKPKKNKTRGIICADCQWAEFDDFCASQGCSANYPIRHYP